MAKEYRPETESTSEDQSRNCSAGLRERAQSASGDECRMNETDMKCLKSNWYRRRGDVQIQARPNPS
jgi:hypothetical protein